MNPRPGALAGVVIVCILALNFTSCTLGVGRAGSELVGRVSRSLSSGPLDHLPSAELKSWAVRPGPELIVEQNRPVSSRRLLNDAEVSAMVPAARTGLRFRDRLSDVTSGIASVLAMTDAWGIVIEQAILQTDSEGFQPFEGPDRETRKQLVLHESPFVILHGEKVLYSRAGKSGPVTAALATRRAKITVITHEGSYFALANRIHIRGASKEIILEGNPMVQTGHQHIRAAKPDGLMTLNVSARTVTLGGDAVVTHLWW